ncbi:YunC family protein [Cohnella suwonensis]|uniref:YunC family protein n=1 Tax=Cohnella suwonensis TaxID=696072 RepID=A0ABW0LV51_9BACL
MVKVVPFRFDDWTAIGVEVLLPKTTLIAISVGDGYIMCGALDVHLLNTRLKDRGIVAGRAVGVRTFEQLLEAPLESVTDAAEALGIHAGMTGQDALRIMAAHA